MLIIYVGIVRKECFLNCMGNRRICTHMNNYQHNQQTKRLIKYSGQDLKASISTNQQITATLEILSPSKRSQISLKIITNEYSTILRFWRPMRRTWTSDRIILSTSTWKNKISRIKLTNNDTNNKWPKKNTGKN